MFIRQRYLLLIFYVKQNRNVDTKVTQQNWFRFFIRFTVTSLVSNRFISENAEENHGEEEIEPDVEDEGEVMNLE